MLKKINTSFLVAILCLSTFSNANANISAVQVR
jgi:hypothetical protein